MIGSLNGVLNMTTIEDGQRLTSDGQNVQRGVNGCTLATAASFRCVSSLLTTYQQQQHEPMQHIKGWLTIYSALIRHGEAELATTRKGTRRAKVLNDAVEMFTALIGTGMIEELKWTDADLLEGGFTPELISKAHDFVW